MLDSSSVPVINLQTVKPEHELQRAVAISHVWSDGLGNPKQNSLPMCQYQRLQKLIASFPHGGESTEYVWIDTLCCPTALRKARNIAIQRMKQVYESARFVLVLDSYLLSQNANGLSSIEILMRIFCSHWNRRLWTLQERLLAKDRLVYQFQDKPVYLNDVFDEMKSKTSSTGASRPSVGPTSQALEHTAILIGLGNL